MKNLPIGFQDFADLINFKCVYVDKTKLIYQLATTGKNYFLSRPRRFGKSLLCSTISALFSGKKELFDGLWVASSECNYDWPVHPVLHLSMSKVFHPTVDGFVARLSIEMDSIAKGFGLNTAHLEFPTTKLIFIIESLAQRGSQVVLLIDEYDYPIVSSIPDEAKANQMVEILKNFYTPLKDLNAHIRMLFVTGISKFAHTSLFSGLNQLEDLTIDREMATILGYTENEIISSFPTHLAAASSVLKIPVDKVMERMRGWYNGYRFHQDSLPVYNPFSVLNFLKQKDFKEFWFATGTPTFLIKLVREKEYPPEMMGEIRATAKELGAHEVGRMPFKTLLFQTGYLTIGSAQTVMYDPFGQESTTEYLLTFPNFEVRSSYFESLLTVIKHL